MDVFKGDKPDTSAQERLQKKQEELAAQQRARMKKQDAEIAAERASRRKRGQGRSSLISFSERGRSATGIPTRTSLG